MGSWKAGEPFTKPRQASPATLHGFACQVPVFIQAIALAHGFLQVFHPLDMSELVAPDFKAKTVGAEVDRGEACAVLHVVLGRELRPASYRVLRRTNGTVRTRQRSEGRPATDQCVPVL